MINKENLIYSISATARILNISKSEIVKIEVWHKTVWIKLVNQRPQLISKQVYLQHFVDWRKSRANNLTVVESIFNPDSYFVYNPIKNTRYAVTIYKGNLSCTCEDYKNQIETLGKGCCKHGYAVLQHLGHSSLQSYIEKQKVA